jgi:hypothetical protein
MVYYSFHQHGTYGNSYPIWLPLSQQPHETILLNSLQNRDTPFILMVVIC